MACRNEIFACDNISRPVSKFGKNKAFAQVLSGNYAHNLGLYVCNGIIALHEGDFAINYMSTPSVIVNDLSCDGLDFTVDLPINIDV